MHKTGAWVPAYFYCETWVIGDATYPGNTFSITKVGPRIPTPDENWQCVPKELDEGMVESVIWAVDESRLQGMWVDLLSAAPDPGEL